MLNTITLIIGVIALIISIMALVQTIKNAKDIKR